MLHPNTGMMTFTPNVYAGSSFFYDTYTVVVEAAIYRTINGIPTKVSASQRNLPVYIIDNPANLYPELVQVTANGQPIQPDQVVEVPRGSTLRFQFNTYDANAGDILTVILPDQQFPGFPANTVTSLSAGTRPSGSITFNASGAVADQLFYFPVTVMDNACPARGVTTRIYGVKLFADPTGTGELLFIDPGFAAFPNPFSDQVTFRSQAKTKNQRILIFNLLGQQIDQISFSKTSSGEQNITWQNAGNHAAGTYVARLISEDKTIQTLKFTKLQ